MSEERFMFRWCLVHFVSLLVTVRILSQDYVKRGDLAIDISL